METTTKRQRVDSPRSTPHGTNKVALEQLAAKIAAFQNNNDSHSFQPETICKDMDSSCRSNLVKATQTVRAYLHDLYQLIDTLKAVSSPFPERSIEPIDIHRVLAYSHRLSLTTSAPPGYVPGQSFLYLSKPPAPQVSQVQASVLHTLHEEQATTAHAATQTMLATHTKNAIGTQQIQSKETVTSPQQKEEERQNDTLEVLAGMNIPADVLKNLPPMPKEWKPGDPIPGLGGIQGPQGLKKQEEVSPPGQTDTTIMIKEKPKPQPAFAFALNPDMDIEFGAATSSSEDESDSDDD